MIFILPVLIVLVDQFTKFQAIKYLKDQKPYVIIKDYFELHYVENYGAAFGILQQMRVLFLIITSLVLLFIIFYLFKNHQNLTVLAKFSIMLLLGGAIGNFIDRARLGYVVDFLRVNVTKSYDFPVFNIADMAIVVSTIFIVYVVLFDKYEV